MFSGLTVVVAEKLHPDERLSIIYKCILLTGQAALFFFYISNYNWIISLFLIFTIVK